MPDIVKQSSDLIAAQPELMDLKHFKLQYTPPMHIVASPAQRKALVGTVSCDPQRSVPQSVWANSSLHAAAL